MTKQKSSAIFVELNNLKDVEVLAKNFSKELSVNLNLVIYLEGNLGVGKTTFVRYVLNYLGYQDKVKSPTYTIIEPYLFDSYEINHFDLYRLTDSEELIYLGIDDYFTEKSIVFIEWPENGGEELPEADLVFHYQYAGEVRKLLIKANTKKAELILKKLASMHE